MEAADLEKVQDRISLDPFARFLGMQLVEVGAGYARVELVVREEMMNFHGVTHGGAVSSLADTTFAAASNSHERTALALNVSINFLAATAAGSRLVATTTEEKLGHRTAVYLITVEDERGKLVAVAEGLVYRKSESFTDTSPRAYPAASTTSVTAASWAPSPVGHRFIAPTRAGPLSGTPIPNRVLLRPRSQGNRYQNTRRGTG